MSSRSASTGGSTRSTPSARCSASQAVLRRRPMPTSIPARGRTLHLVGVCVNRIGTERSTKEGQREYNALTARLALQAIADGQSDVDAYMALVPPEQWRLPHRAAEIGRRLLSAGRATEALDVLERAKPNPSEAKAERC